MFGVQPAAGGERVLTALEWGADSKWTSALDKGTKSGGSQSRPMPWWLDVGG